MGVRTRSACFGVGNGGRRIGWNDQNCRSSSVISSPGPIFSGSA